jgi:hypothetical protein
MANVDGSWNTVTKSPLGDQQAVLTVQSAGDSFTGNFSGGWAPPTSRTARSMATR